MNGNEISIGRVTMLEFGAKEDLKTAEAHCDKIKDSAFSTLDLVSNMRACPTSLVSIACYPS